jgi:hypothetical protein
MTEINVSWTSFDVVSDEFLFGPAATDESVWVHPHVYDWIEDHRVKGHKIELCEWMVPWVGPEAVTMRLEGVTFQFEDPSIAMLFKLTWGGK